MFVVPKGIEHKPYADKEVKLLLIEPRGVLNTGDEGGEANGQEQHLDLIPATEHAFGLRFGAQCPEWDRSFVV
jgi:hypothetical protein